MDVSGCSAGVVPTPVVGTEVVVDSWPEGAMVVTATDVLRLLVASDDGDEGTLIVEDA